jgi:hypothetical protein
MKKIYYEPVIKRDELGNIVSVIHCPYIPKSLADEPTEGTV